MVIRTRWLWIGWGPDIVNLRGWRLDILFLPRPDLTPIGELVKGSFRIAVKRTGPSIFQVSAPKSTDSFRWTGLEFDWPPTFSIAFDRC